MSKKHWLSELCDLARPSNKTRSGKEVTFDPEYLKQTILDTIKSKLPEEKIWDMSMDKTGGEVDAWNECLKAVRAALLEEK